MLQATQLWNLQFVCDLILKQFILQSASSQKILWHIMNVMSKNLLMWGSAGNCSCVEERRVLKRGETHWVKSLQTSGEKREQTRKAREHRHPSNSSFPHILWQTSGVYIWSIDVYTIYLWSVPLQSKMLAGWGNNNKEQVKAANYQNGKQTQGLEDCQESKTFRSWGHVGGKGHY